MIDRLIAILSMTWPILGAAGMLIAASLPRRILETMGPARISIRNWLIFEGVLPIAAYRIVLVMVAGVFIMLPPLRDYSTFFPQRVTMDVYFDDAGIVRALAEYTTEELDVFRIADDWKQRKQGYFQSINSDLAVEQVDFQFEANRTGTTSRGDAIFRVQMVEWGTQTYQIVESHGALRISRPRPDNTVQEIASEFELLDTPGRWIRASLWDVYLKRSVVIAPEYKQVFRLAPTKSIFHHTVTTITKVYLLPPDIGRSIYLATADDGSKFPIGYAVYAQ